MSKNIKNSDGSMRSKIDKSTKYDKHDRSKIESSIKQIDDVKTKISEISLIDTLIYILIPTPMIIFYPLIIGMALQKNFSKTINRLYLTTLCFILNMLLMPILIPIGIFLGIVICTTMFPLLTSVYIIIFLSDAIGINFPLHNKINDFKRYVPKFRVDKTDRYFTEEYMSDNEELNND